MVRGEMECDVMAVCDGLVVTVLQAVESEMEIYIVCVFVKRTFTTSLYGFFAVGDSSGDETKQQKNDDKNPFLFFFFSFSANIRKKMS